MPGFNVAQRAGGRQDAVGAHGAFLGDFKHAARVFTTCSREAPAASGEPRCGAGELRRRGAIFGAFRIGARLRSSHPRVRSKELTVRQRDEREGAAGSEKSWHGHFLSTRVAATTVVARSEEHTSEL